MPDDNNNKGGLRHSTRLDHPNHTHKPGSLTKLLLNKKGRKSFSFEEDDGFVFKRAAAPSLTNRTTKKQSEEVPRDTAKPKKTKQITLKKSRLSILAQIETPSEDEELQQQQQQVPKKRGRKPKQDFSLGVEEPTNKKRKKQPTRKPTAKVQPPVSPPISSPTRSNYEEEHETSIQMLLPISDSPIQRQNKKFRDSTKRRSSLGNRGKRASSIGNGFVAVPHIDVPVQDFHKHLDESLPEPHKMRKLLIWCAKRLLVGQDEDLKKLKSKNEASSEELTAFNIAKVIKEEIIRDLVDGRLNTSWYNRVDSDLKDESKQQQQQVKLLPNIQNLTNASNIKVLQKRLKDLQDEKLKWHAAYDQIPKLTTKIEPTTEQSTTTIQQQQLSQEILVFTTKYENFNTLRSQSLESKIDHLDSLVNKLSTNDRVLSLLQQKIKTRINEMVNSASLTHHKEVDTEDLLKGISRIEGEEEEEQ